jgi:hypothetical protein
MQYFFIFGNIASIAALLGFLMQLGDTDSGVVFRYTALGTAIATLLFWVYFYFSPENKVANAIKKRLDYSGNYADSSAIQIKVFEDEFVARDFGGFNLALPPFEEVPEVDIYPRDGRVSGHWPRVDKVTKDSVRISVNATDAFGTWVMRARGKALRAQPGG